MKEKEREIERTLQQAAKQLSRERREWKERETGLQEKLQLTRRNLRTAREEAQNAQLESRNLDEQMKMWRTIANKFKKNASVYYTLKAKTRAPEYHDSDDSLEII
ncbi:hypothetical protein WOLCODRAFT_148708 [Wolfiporia cocos MD-104 SS10]|uniref:Uncharacterized protein n=1 Tax=Wolfiporia cocos (strain MD-104) TaxID=742152 RepID=A0A2H3J671_WOLCO|nr:hypothetical protein WOLCODRAFT_148708 [Wolfiporia cocos MD-104 SS10]